MRVEEYREGKKETRDAWAQAFRDHPDKSVLDERAVRLETLTVGALIHITRGTADREALRRCVYVLQSGQPLVMFPEGERKSGAVVEKLFDGAVYVAIKANVPIIPVGIGGSEAAMPKGSKMVRPARCAMVIGKPIVVDGGDKSRAARSSVKAMSEELQHSLQNLLDIAQKSVEPRRVKSSTK